MSAKNDKTKNEKKKRETMSTNKTEECDLLGKISEVLRSKEKLKPLMEPMLELIKEKNQTASPDEKWLKLVKNLLNEITEVLKSKTELKPYVVPMLELIKEKNQTAAPDEKVLNLERDYEKRLEKLKGPKKTENADSGSGKSTVNV